MAIDPEAFDAFDAKEATPDTSVPEGAVLFGADSQSASSPSVYPLSNLAAAINAANSVAAPSPDSSANTAAIQAALDAVPDGGGQVRIDKPGTYLLSAAGANPYYEGHRCCLEIKKSNTHLWIGPGVTLKLDDGQQTDADGPVDIIVWSALDGVTINGGGTIDGNAAGQTDWSGGYAQVTNGCIIYDCTPAASSSSRIRIEDLTLHSHFSNPINITRGGTTSHVTIQRIRAYDCGEGIQVINGAYVDILNCDVSDPSDVSVGDGIELSTCTHWRIDGCRVSENGSGAAFDLWGSKYGILSNFQVTDWGGGGVISAGTTAGGVTVDQVIADGGLIRGATGSNILEVAEGRLIYKNITAIDCAGTLFQMADDDAEGTMPPVELHNVLGIGCGRALITGSRRVIWKGGGNRDCHTFEFGVSVEQNSSGETRNLFLYDLDLTGNSTGMRCTAGGLGPMYMVGIIDGLTLDAGAKIASTPQDDFTGMVVRRVKPDILEMNNSTVPNITGFRALRRTLNPLLTLQNPSEGQEVVIEATGSATVIDQSQENGVDIYLAGSENFAMAAGDRLALRWNGTGWYELYRTVA